MIAPNPGDWSSLASQRELAERLFGPRGARLMSNWLAEQIDRISDPDFARLFTNHINIPGAEGSDYCHRLIQSSHGNLLGGIRFFDGDVARPYVEVMAHDFTETRRLVDCVAYEWQTFKPLHLRTLEPCGERPTRDAQVDMTLFAGAYRDLASPDGRVSLHRFDTAQQAIDMVFARYAEVETSDPDLARNISPADADELREWHEAGHAWAIRSELHAERPYVGVLAVVPCEIKWIEGDEIHEEVVLGQYCGHGFAASAQRAWAAQDHVEPDRLLIGTIDRLNIASQRSAMKTGRVDLLDYVFTPISPAS